MAFLLFEDERLEPWAIHDGAVVGRDPSCDLVLSDGMVSRRHLRFTKGIGAIIWEDLGSTHGTFHNGDRSPRGTLNEGDRLCLGGTTELRFSRSRPERAAADRVDVTLERPQFPPERELLDNGELRFEYERLRGAFELTRAVGSETDPDLVVDRIIDCVFQLLAADRAQMILLDEEGDAQLKKGRTRSGEEIQADIPKTILQEVRESRRATLSADAAKDQRFSRSESIMSERIRSTMTVPLVWESDLLGVLQVDTQSAINAFGRRDLDLFVTLASQAALSLRSASLKDRLLRRDSEERERLQQMLDTLPVGVLLLDAACRVHGANPEARRLLAMAGQEGQDGDLSCLDGRTVERLMAAVHEGSQDVEFGEKVTAFVSGVARALPRRDGKGWLSVLSLQDVTERRRQEAAAREAEIARKEAELASEAKSRFLAHMSHEIRTPLNAVIGMSELAMGEAPQGELGEYVETIGASANRLLGMVNDILDLSKIESELVEVEAIDFEVEGVLQEVTTSLVPLARAKGLKVTATMGARVPSRIVGDPTRLGQILSNLFGNATKFTEEGELALQVEMRGEALRFTVRDTGVGMTPEQLATVFEPFRQADASTTRRFGGTGLGLAISRQLAELMGGRLWAESSPGEGSAFHFEMPTPPAPEALSGQVVSIEGPPEWRAQWVRRVEEEGATVASPSSAQLRIRHEAAEGEPAPGDLVVHPPGVGGHRGGDHFRTVREPVSTARLLAPKAPVQAAPAELQGLMVLVVEDNTVNQRVAQRLLERLGHRVEIAPNGRAALTQVQVLEPDVVLMDVQMPEMDGLEATRAIRKLATPVGQVPIIALTACATTRDAERCREAGMTGYLSKPLRSAGLQAALAETVPPGASRD